MSASGKLASARDLAMVMPQRWGMPTGLRLLGDPGGISATLLTGEPSEVDAEPSAAHIFSFVVEGEERHRLWHDNRPVFDGALPDRSFNIVPFGVAPRAVIERHVKVLHVYLPHVDLARRAQQAGWSGGPGALEIVDPRNASDDALESICLQFIRVLGSSDPLDRMSADHLTGAISTRVLQRWSNISARHWQTDRGGLASWQVRRVTECLEAHLADDLSLDALSQLVSLTPNHFCTAFRISFGEPPHRYVVRRRIERAKEMLADPRRNVTDVAMAVGFGSSAHFATAFRKAVGLTPSAYRRSIS